MKQELPLQDIVEAHDIHWWPLAWGWWLAIALLVVILALLIFRHYRHQYQQRGIRLLQQRLQTPQTSLAAVNLALKQAALCYYPRQQIAPLDGAAWHRFLVNQLPPPQRDAFAQQLAPYTDMQYQPPSAEGVLAYQRLLLSWAEHAWPPNPKEVTHV